MSRITIQKTDEAAFFASLKETYFPTGKTELVYDNTAVPPIDEITPYTNAIAAHATLISPIRQYPGSSK